MKGRDYFDLVFYVQRKARINLQYLESKLRQSGHYTAADSLTIEQVRKLYLEKIAHVDFKKAQDDVLAFIKPEQARSVRAWSREIFQALSLELQG